MRKKVGTVAHSEGFVALAYSARLAGPTSVSQNRPITLHASTQLKLDEFLASQEKRAYQMAYFATKSRDEALDIVQDSMFKLVQKYSARAPEEWPPLFTRIVQNRIKNWYRRDTLNRALFAWFDRVPESAASESMAESATPPLEEHSGGLLSSKSTKPDNDVYDQHFLGALENALRELPLRQQQVFLLRAVQGYDVAETSAAMQCSAGSVKTHYSRALRKLQDKLGEFAL